MGEGDRGVDRAIRHQLGWSSLTAERERYLLNLAQTDPNADVRQAALTELWESHSKLVIAIANRHRRANIDVLDLVGAGHLGLHAAIERFDPDRYQSRLSSYAFGWIRWYIQDYIRRNSGPVRLPDTTAHRQLSRGSARLVVEARRSCERDRVEPTDSEICARIGRRIGLPANEVARSLQMIRGGTLSLHRLEADHDEPAGLEDTLADDTICPEDAAILRLDHDKLRRRIQGLADEILGERERVVFLERCIADGDDVPHLDELAARFGVSRERVYQIETSARRKIVSALAQEGYTGFVSQGGEIRLPQTRAKRRQGVAASRRDRAEALSAAAD